MSSTLFPPVKRLKRGWLTFIMVLLGVFTAFAQLSINFTTNHPTCFAASNGSVQATASGGAGPYSYVWSTGELGSTLLGIAAGNYSVTATDANGSSSTATVTLTEPSVLTLQLSVNDDCSEPFDITALAGGGVFPYAYNWNTGATTTTITNVPAGTYCVTVIDDNNCGATNCITVDADPPAVAVSKINVSCPGGMDGSAVATVIGGQAPFMYLWNTGATTATLNNIPAGTYTVTITDGNGCTDEATVTLSSPPDINIDMLISNPACTDDANGSISATVSGGTPPYTYLWNTGATAASLFNLTAGTYSLTVTDANNCVATQTRTLFNISNLIVSAFGTHETCPDANDGFLTASSSGGVLPLTYQWSNGATTQVVTDVAPGIYSLTITDALGCSGTSTTPVNAAEDFIIELLGMDISTCGAVDGSVSVNLISGEGPFTYLWNTGATTATIENLPAGTYSVTLTNAMGCIASGTTAIVEPPPVFISAIPTDLVCFGQNTGTVTTTVTGGTPPFVYQWNNGQTTPNISNLPPGSYSVSVSDANNCMATTSVEIGSPEQLTITTIGTDLLCFNDNMGSIDVTVMGGTPPYSFSWSNGATTEDLSNLTAGTYTGTVTDANGCTATMSETIVQPPLIVLTVDNDAICTAQTSATLSASLSGGTPPYTYIWSNGETTVSINNLPTGLYGLTITDANGCQETATAEVVEIPNPSCGINLIQESTLGNNGILEATATGGQPPYSFFWNTGATTAVISNLPPGAYSVTITDQNACQSVCTAVLEAYAGIGDYVWEDLDIDGQQDDNEPPVPGVNVTLHNNSRDIIATTVTDTNGLYFFGNLPPDTYFVQFEIPDGFSYTLSNVGNDASDSDIIQGMNGRTGEYVLSAGEINLTVDAGIYRTPVPVVGDPCSCLNNATDEFNGQFREVVDIMSYPGQNWIITDQLNLFSVDSPAPPAPPIPVALGTPIPEISPGFYELEFRLVDELMYFIEFTNGIDTFSFTNTCIYPTITVNELPPDSLCVFDDIFPLSGTSSVPGLITFTLNGEEVTEIDPATLPFGNNELLAQLVPIDPNDCIGVLTYQFFVVTSCTAKVGDFVWLDNNRDGIQDASEPGIPGVTVTITSTEVGTSYTDISETDNLGLYCFDVPPGEYKITFDPPTNLLPSAANQGNNDSIDSDMDTVTFMTIPIAIGPNEINLTIDAGFYNKCDNVTDPGNIGYDQTLCGPGVDPEAFVELAVPTGGTGELEFLWMKTTGNPNQDIQFWTPIPNTNTPTYDPGPVFETTYFTRCVRRECCTAYLESNILTINVENDAIALIDGPAIVCEGEEVTFTAVGVQSGTNINWEFSGGATVTAMTDNSISLRWNTFGVFQIELWVTENNCTSFAAKNVTVSSSPGACGSGFQITADILNMEAGLIQLSWEMENIFPDFQYWIEYSEDGVHFDVVTLVEQPDALSGNMLRYTYVEEAPRRGRNYYRVRIRDHHTLSLHSNVQEIILFNDSQIALLYPVPVVDRLTLELFDVQGVSQIGIELYDINGRILSRKEVDSNAPKVLVDMSAYPAGTYFLRLRLGDTTVKTMKVLKQ